MFGPVVGDQPAAGSWFSDSLFLSHFLSVACRQNFSNQLMLTEKETNQTTSLCLCSFHSARMDKLNGPSGGGSTELCDSLSLLQGFYKQSFKFTVTVPQFSSGNPAELPC
ncbi:hypothetical protein AMECASPLE_029525 [Ameca splendens]|uniref:Uncharacterized protein n=1 Tax=Ameca splendens TaxID=208324 RepID=A0ABV0YGX2_9TELE